MSNWRCPHCGTPQGEASRCWSCGRSPFACSSCRNFRRAVSATLGTCTQNRVREVLTGDEVRPCWQTREVVEVVPFLGLFGALNPVDPEAPVAEPERGPEPEPEPAAAATPLPAPAPTPAAAPEVPTVPPPAALLDTPPAMVTPPSGSVVGLAATLASPVEEESREVWLAAGGTALLADDLHDATAAQVAGTVGLVGASIDRMIAELLVAPEPAAAPPPAALAPPPAAVAPSMPSPAVPIVALVPPMPSGHASAPSPTPSTGSPVDAAASPALPVPGSVFLEPPAPAGPLPPPERPRPIVIPVTPDRTPLAPPWAQPTGGPLRPPDARPAPDPGAVSPDPGAAPLAGGSTPPIVTARSDPARPLGPGRPLSPARPPLAATAPGPVDPAEPPGTAQPPGPEPGDGTDGRRPPALALLPATLANRFRRGMAGLGWREPAPPLFSASARAGRPSPPLAPSAEPRPLSTPMPAAPPPIRKYTPPPPPTAVPGRLVEAPWVPPRASSLPLGEQLRRTELARRDRPLADVEGLGGRGGGDAGA